MRKTNRFIVIKNYVRTSVVFSFLIWNILTFPLNLFVFLCVVVHSLWDTYLHEEGF